MNYQEIIEKTRKLESPRLVLREVTSEDAKTVYLYASDEEVTKYLTFETHNDISQSQYVVENFLQKPGVFLIEERNSREGMGIIDLRLDAENDKAGFGYAMARKYWGKGYATEALSALLVLAFESLGLIRVTSYCSVENKASARVMEKCGMKLEGCFESFYKWKGVHVDVKQYGITKSEYEQFKSEARK